jgi:hypothetical protein
LFQGGERDSRVSHAKPRAGDTPFMGDRLAIVQRSL